MLDLSIKQVSNAHFSDSRLQIFFGEKYLVTEKFDGTKLTITRNFEPFDEKDYTKNWIISYKGNILHKEEFNFKNIKEIRNSSIGISQYAIVHKHLSKVHKDLDNIEKGREFFIEFIQRKPTVTRQYKKYHDMFLICTSLVSFTADDFLYKSQVKSKIIDILDDFEYLNFCNQLNFKPLPILYSGHFHYNSKDLKKSLIHLENLFLDFESQCGNKPEGVVIYSQNSSQKWKIIQKDQHSSEVRSLMHKRWEEQSILDELEYWKKIKDASTKQFNNLDLSRPNKENLQKLRQIIDKTHFKINHSNKTELHIKDDIYLSTKLSYMLRYRIGFETNKLGLIAMAAKPLHQGHWQIISKAQQECDVVFLFLSTKGRKKGNDFDFTGEMTNKLLTIYSQNLPNNVHIILSSSPLNDLEKLSHDILIREQFLSELNIYHGAKDDLNISESCLKDYIKVIPVPISIDISGSQMRELVISDDELRFKNNLPEIFSNDTKTEIWQILKNNK